MVESDLANPRERKELKGDIQINGFLANSSIETELLPDYLVNKTLFVSSGCF